MDTEILKDEINKRIDEALKDCPGAGVCRGMIRRNILAYWCEYRVLPELRIEKRPVIASPSRFPLRANQAILIQASGRLYAKGQRKSARNDCRAVF